MPRMFLACVTILTLTLTSHAQSAQPPIVLRPGHSSDPRRSHRCATPERRHRRRCHRAEWPAVVSYGRLDANDPRPPTGDTVFEIGSVTKVFTSLLLADMVQHGEVPLDDPSPLPSSGTKVPERGGRQITLARSRDAHLRPPATAGESQAEGPDQSVRRLHGRSSSTLSSRRYELPRDIGANVRVLESRRRPARARAGCGRGDRLRDARADARSLAPLGMKRHRHQLSPDHAGAPRRRARRRRAPGRELGSRRCSPARARCGRRRTTC